MTIKPAKMSEQTRIDLLDYYTNIPISNFHPDLVKKRIGLTMLGFKKREIDEMCRPKPRDVVKDAERLAQYFKECDKELDKINRENRKLAKPKAKMPVPDLDKPVEITILDKDMPDKTLAFKAKWGGEEERRAYAEYLEAKQAKSEVEMRGSDVKAEVEDETDLPLKLNGASKLEMENQT